MLTRRPSNHIFITKGLSFSFSLERARFVPLFMVYPAESEYSSRRVEKEISFDFHWLDQRVQIE